METLPIDILKHKILSYLTPFDIIQFVLTNKNNYFLYKTMIHKYFTQQLNNFIGNIIPNEVFQKGYLTGYLFFQIFNGYKIPDEIIICSSQTFDVANILFKFGYKCINHTETFFCENDLYLFQTNKWNYDIIIYNHIEYSPVHELSIDKGLYSYNKLILPNNMVDMVSHIYHRNPKFNLITSDILFCEKIILYYNHGITFSSLNNSDIQNIKFLLNNKE